MTQIEVTERVIDVAVIEPRFRHNIIGQLFKHLEPGHSLQIVVDHDPQRLRFHLDFAFGELCEWSYLKQGPDVWRVRLRHARIDAETELKDANGG
jgi:uncharacterized protein (DUF2249 family)